LWEGIELVGLGYVLAYLARSCGCNLVLGLAIQGKIRTSSTLGI
jgi:hypothetical protein